MVHVPEFGRGIFVCSKPLQFLVCASIVRRYQISAPQIFIVARDIADTAGFLSFLHSSSYKDLFAHIEACSDHFEAVDSIRRLDLGYDSLFVEDDRVSKYRLFTSIKSKYMMVFEEGLATYQGDYRAPRYHLEPKWNSLRKLKWMVLAQLTGCGLFFGHGRKTNYVMVQFPEVYAALNPTTATKALPVPRVIDEFRNARKEWDGVVERCMTKLLSAAGNVALVLGTWGGVPSDKVKEILRSHDVVYYKAHPHDSGHDGAAELNVLAESWIPAEVFVDYLARRCTSLTVYHFNSTAAINCFARYDNVSFFSMRDDARFAAVTEQLCLSRPIVTANEPTEFA